MRRKNAILAGLVVLAVVHIGVAASMIWRHENTLRNGDLYRFKTRPVDPYDAFRGRYVALRINTSVPAAERFSTGEVAYVSIKVDEDGFAEFERAYQAPPDQPYVKATVRRYRRSAAIVDVHNPFDRYYMNETLAPAAERAYRKHSRREKRNACIAVRIKDGYAVVEELYIDDRPIADYLAGKGR